MKRVECPAENMAMVPWEKCRGCSMFNINISGVFDHCRGKQLISDELSGRKMERKIKEYLEDGKTG